MWEAGGLADLGNVADDEDIDALKALAIAVDAGLPADALVQLIRVYADATARIAEAEARLIDPRDTTGRLPMAVAFVDLARFTTMTGGGREPVLLRRRVRRAVVRAGPPVTGDADAGGKACVLRAPATTTVRNMFSPSKPALRASGGARRTRLARGPRAFSRIPS